ncbi:MAG: helix-turn-helix domain-containing protein [Fimbriimonas sp.]
MSVVRTTGSVYHALDLENADDMERKARLVSAINDTIEAMGLTQVQAAEIVGIDQPTLSKLLRGRFRSVSIEKLAHMLNALGRDVTIVVGAMPQHENERGRTLVAVS